MGELLVMHRKIALFILGITLLGGHFVHSDSGSRYPRMTLESGVRQADETRMAIEGIFLRQNRGEEDEFVFRDSDGREIVVYDRQAGKNVRFNVPVVINGEIDRGVLRTEFNLHSAAYLNEVSEGEAAEKTSSSSAATANAVDSRDGVFIHLSSGPDQPRRVAMALTLASAFAGETPVLVYADLDAVSLLTREGVEIAPEGYRALSEQLPALIQAGVRIRVCPTCLAAAGYSSADLRAGVQLADKREFLSFTDGRILSVDY